MGRVPPTLTPQLDVDVDVSDEGLSIGEVAAAVGLSMQTPRCFEREGLLLEPTARRSCSARITNRSRGSDLCYEALVTPRKEFLARVVCSTFRNLDTTAVHLLEPVLQHRPVGLFK